MTKLAVKEVYRDRVHCLLYYYVLCKCLSPMLMLFPSQSKATNSKGNFISEPFCAILDAIVILCEKAFPRISEMDVFYRKDFLCKC